MTRAEKEAALADLSSRIFSAMLGEVAMDTALQVHKEERRSRSVCGVCGMRCGQEHLHDATVPGSSRAASPSASNADGTPMASSSIPSGTNKTDGNHLATCLGVGTGVRRSVQRNAVTKTKMNTNGRSDSPYVDETLDETKIGGKGKTRAKAKSSGGYDDDPSGTQKRPGTPQGSPSKKQKRGKGAPSSIPLAASGTGPPRLPGSHRLGLPGSNPKSSSKLRSTPTPSVASLVSKNSRSPSAHSDSSDSDADSAGEAESHSSVVGELSPSLPAAESIGRNNALGRSRPGSFTSGTGSVGGGANGKAKKVTGTGPPAKKLPPQVHRLPSPKTLPPPVPVRRPESNYLIDIEGEETGSDTD
ncbi:hypothetical protein DFH11DRAFT_72906 [Phellopilus nigrolimitatus]|nr:hypothetical protein DFH11DRAFT_72906 [Phellopilus nigrolimitatus]